MKLAFLDQVARYDGNKVFMEVMANSLAVNKVLLNFCEYDKSAKSGSRMNNTIGIYMGIMDAAVLAEDILSGKLDKMGKKSRAEAEARGSRYPREVYKDMGGSQSDTGYESRQLLIVPGSKFPWMLTAMKGPGSKFGTGLIKPDYDMRTADAIIRVPMTEENMRKLAMNLRGLYQLWCFEKFGSLNNFDINELSGYDEKTGMKKTSLMGYVAQHEDCKDGIATMRMNIRCSALPINKALFEFTPSDWSIDPKDDKALLSMYMDIETAALLANDILSAKLPKMGATARKAGEPNKILFQNHGGSVAKKTGYAISRLFQITNPENDRWVITAMQGPGKRNETGLIVPCYDRESANVCYDLTTDNDGMKRIALLVNLMFNIWGMKKFGSVVGPRIEEEKKKTQELIYAKAEEKNKDK